MNWVINVTVAFIAAFIINWNINPCYPLEWFAIGYIITLSLPWIMKRVYIKRQ